MGSFRIEVGNGKIVFRRAVLGIGEAREIPFSDIAQILPVTSATKRRTGLLHCSLADQGWEEADARRHDR